MFRVLKLLHRRKILLPILFVCLADGLAGVSYGASATSQDVALWIPLILSILVLAGASEFIFLAILTSGGSPFMGALAGLLINSRHLPFGLSIQQLIPKGSKGALACHLLNDESVAFGLSQTNKRLNLWAFWACGVGIFLFWPGGVLLGGYLGQFINDPKQLGLDVMFPTVLIALTLPNLIKQKLCLPASLGSVTAIALTPFLAVGLAPLAGLIGLCFQRSSCKQI